jgi:putative iron-dependent peroxidase
MGGSYVIVQKYLHDLAAWNALTTQEQENVIGRSKSANIEMPDDVKPPDSHVALNTITDKDGNEQKIVRENMPFGTIGKREFGTYFIGYSRTPEVTERMLRNMFLGDRPGIHDRILDYSKATTGCLFYVPTVDFFDNLPPSPRG